MSDAPIVRRYLHHGVLVEHVDWSAAEKLTLRTLWDEGHSTAEIGRRINRSKNSVVSQSHKLDLPSRPSPIIRTPGYVPVPRPRVHRTTSLPPLQSVLEAAKAPRLPKPPPALKVAIAASPRPSWGCMFPMWPSDQAPPKNPEFCGKPVTFRKSLDGETKWSVYCEQHHLICYHSRGSGHGDD